MATRAEHRWVDESPVDGWNCADCGHPGPATPDLLAEVERRWHQTVPPASVYGRSLTAIVRDVRDGGGS